ncbi:unnamed protein product [Echinostoma caproni]|uniref:CCHC-type domain-containing protein n=1 Tax=Echinostoma caproni TaxID=27848 RepID=A0A183B1R3_9TREM|nr:unnamed protein product [Echinostoma caproni]
MSNSIRQRLLEKYNLDLQHTFEEARMLEHAQQQSQLCDSTTYVSYGATSMQSDVAAPDPVRDASEPQTDREEVIGAMSTLCFFCGRPGHPRSKCPAREAICNSCEKGHFQGVC